MEKERSGVWQMVQRVVPGLRLARTYPRRWLRADFLSALTLSAMLIPQGLAYAQIVGVRPVAGLYAGIFAMLAYALFGASRHLPGALCRAGRAPGTHGGRHQPRGRAGQGGRARGLPLQFDAPLFFANVRHLREQARALVAGAHFPVKWFLVDTAAVFDLDVTAAEGLESLRVELEEEGVVLAIAQAKAPLRELLRRTGLMESIGPENVHPTVGEAVRRFLALYPEAAGQPPAGAPPAPPAVH